VNGATLPEYLVAVSGSQVSCWIPSEVGQKFTVYWRDHGGKVDTCAFINLDGYVAPGRFLFGEGVAWRQGVRSSLTSERPFTFQKVAEERDDPSSQKTNVGTITLRIKRIERVASRPANPLQPIPDTVLGKRRAGEHYIGFGEEQRAYDQFAYTWSVRPYAKDVPPGAKKPSTYVSFVFRYRSREFLQSQGIMPDTVILSPPSRVPMRRVSSAPATTKPVPVADLVSHSIEPPSPSPSPPRKRARQPSKEMTFLPMGPRRRGPSSETRRSVSWRVLGSPKADGFPGQGMLKFDEEPEDGLDDDDEWLPGRSQ